MTGWASLSQGLRWETNVLNGGRFKVAIRYVKDVAGTGGKLGLNLGGKKIDFTIDPSSSVSLHDNQLELGTVVLPKGKQVIELSAHTIAGAEMVKFLEVILLPE
ncbi:hypothetical protein D3C81_956120 [compost metagenome]